MKIKVWAWPTAVLLLLAAACGPQPVPTVAPTEPPEPSPEPTEVVLTGSVTEGGRLYDKWWKEANADDPSGDQPLWSTQATNTREGADTWRCKECHGWDYLGAEGAYGSGSHFTGFPGVFQSQELSDGELLALLDGTADPEHDFSAMGPEALGSLVTFLQEGMTDLREVIDYDAKSPLDADPDHGSDLYAETCAVCHGQDGRQINFGDEEEPEFLGNIAVDNPWEFVHKVRVGQPGTEMPAALDSDWSMQDVLDVLSYAQGLPTEAALSEGVARGGRLYDKWWTEADVDEPTGDNPLWARQDSNTRSGADTWRCKECHGWDYLGADGAYGSGSHFTGFPGVLEAAGDSEDQLLSQLTGQVDADHDFSSMGDDALANLVQYLQEGVLDVRPYIDSTTKAAVGGDATAGEGLFSANCTACHGQDGRQLNFGSDEEPEYVGTIAVDNPWEFIHKVRAGQPGTSMPAALNNGWSTQDVVDLLTYAQSLPTEAP